jgi:large subunit ribosomal protein L15
MPLQRRLPKRGFVSSTKKNDAEVRLSALDRIPGDTIDILILKQAGLVSGSALNVKVILSGKIERAVKLQGIPVTKGAKAAIEAAGGSVE